MPRETASPSNDGIIQNRDGKGAGVLHVTTKIILKYPSHE